MIAEVRGRGGGRSLHSEVKGRDVLMGLSLMGNARGHNRKAIVCVPCLQDRGVQFKGAG